MSYPYVQAAFDYGPMKVEPVGFVIHMAEGGGTVGYLSRSPARGVSVHYVIEYSGQIVQMLRENRCSGSINPNEIRTSDDADGFYGATAAKAVMGTHWKDPNAACLSVEIEGFASAGPNVKEMAALIVLVDDIRTRHPSIGLLGHRDYTTTKACPGKKIPWTLLGGHGPASGQSAGGNQPVPLGGSDMKFVNANGTGLTSGLLLNVGKGSTWLYLDGSNGGTIPADAALPWVGKGDSVNDQHVVLLATGNPYPDKTSRPSLVLVKSTNDPYAAPAPPAPPVVDCTQAVEDAVAAEHERVRSAAIAAVEGL